MPERNLRIFDTTLRDGEQAPGNGMSIEQKVELAALLDSLGVDTIEAGFAASSPADAMAVREIALKMEGAKVCSLARCDRGDIDAALSALEPACAPQLELAAVGSDIHLRYKRRITRAEGVKELVESVKYAREAGMLDVLVGIEDGSRGTPEYLRPLIEAGLEAGGSAVMIADTVGCTVPSEMRELVGQAKEWAQGAPVSVHCHDDIGLATANTLAAVEGGADEVQVTLCGIGERAGNASLEEVVAAILSRPDHYGCTTSVKLEDLYPASQRLLATISERLPRAKAVVGENAFSTEAGIHQQGLLNHPSTYEFLDPEWFGRERRLVLGRHSGRNVIRHKLAALGLDTNHSILDRIYRELVGGGGTGAFDDDSYLEARYLELLEEDNRRPDKEDDARWRALQQR